jgi:hypothetical protein
MQTLSEVMKYKILTLNTHYSDSNGPGVFSRLRINAVVPIF